MSDTLRGSARRHDVPEPIRTQAVELKTLVDRYAGAMGRHWVADEVVAPSLPLLLVIARTALALHEQHTQFAADTWAA